MIVVSHRGPVSFRRETDGTFSERRGAGGVVSALGPLVAGRDDVHWIAAAISDDDRAAVASGVASSTSAVELLALDPETHRLHYDVISNRILWFLFHGLFDLPRQPGFDRDLHDAWDAYRAINQAFAEAIARTAGPDDTVLVQDLQLCLVPAQLRALRPDVRISHFTHTPFCDPGALRVLPDAIATELCGALAGTAAGFHSDRWARNYRTGVTEVLGPHVMPHAFTATFGPDADELAATAATEVVRVEAQALAERVGDRRCIVRSDRIELSKNIGRGFLAFDELLDRCPEWRDRVTFVAVLNPSRESLDEYREYRDDIDAIAARVNERWATADWEPIVLDARDNYPRSVAALQHADVLLVNPIRDGLNLVAMEGPLVGVRDPVLCLSREAGAFDLLHEHCLEVQPFDVSQTAGVLADALAMSPDERARRADGLRAAARAWPASEWLDALVGHAR
ncbi:MAG: trehalose-6-phosphate synthase [Acidimicrobiia bacterium]